MQWSTLSSFSRVPDMRNLLQENFASWLYVGSRNRTGTWEQLTPEQRDEWREKADRFARGDLSVAPWNQ